MPKSDNLTQSTREKHQVISRVKADCAYDRGVTLQRKHKHSLLIALIIEVWGNKNLDAAIV